MPLTVSRRALNSATVSDNKGMSISKRAPVVFLTVIVIDILNEREG